TSCRNKPKAPHAFLRAATVPAKKSGTLVRLTPAVEKEVVVPVAQPQQALPLYSYKSVEPRPVMRFTRSEAEADEWVEELDWPISMDLEWVVVFRKGGMRPVSLVQVADRRNIVVVQLMTSSAAMRRFPARLQRLLEDPDIPKMGANILNDAKKLFRDYGVMMANVVELGALARQADPSSRDAAVWGPGNKKVALAKLVERYLHKKLSKDDDVRISNWEDPKLEQRQAMLDYAANDAYCGLQVYNHLIALAKANAITLDATKFTDRVHYPCLVAPAPDPAPPPPATSPLPPVPVMHFITEMEVAGLRPQHLRAYRYWHLGKRDIDNMCKELCLKSTTSAGVLARSTVISYVVEAIRGWPTLKYDLGALRLLLQTDLRSWQRHSAWVGSVGRIEALVDKK
ncbi:ribonuclease H-like protein, partial [Mycena rebaudengoi]